jgi:hypothetical protein
MKIPLAIEDIPLEIQAGASLVSYSTAQNYWDFELCPLSGILETRKHNVSETGSVSFIK